MIVKNELLHLLRNIKENIKNLTSEKLLIEFLDNYKNSHNLQKLNEFVKNEIDLTIIGIIKWFTFQKGLKNENKISEFLKNLESIEYLNIFEDHPFFSVGIFLIPSSHTMPIHDHRNMLVFSKILTGEAEIISYDRIVDNCLDDKYIHNINV